MSTQEKPKQFLEIFSDKSLIKETFERLNYKLESKDIFAVIPEKHREQTFKESIFIRKTRIYYIPI